MNVPLICPTCRRPPEAWQVDPSSLVCTNPDCRRAFMRLTGSSIPVIVAGDAPESAAPMDLTSFETVEAWIASLDPGGPEWESAIRAGMYAASDTGPEPLAVRLLDRFDDHLPVDRSAVVDLGCGTGGVAREVARRTLAAVVGLDSNPLFLRIAEAAGPDLVAPTLEGGVRLAARALRSEAPLRPITWICGDVMEPPLPAAVFDLVLAINLLDSVADPALALGQACALVAPGGCLLVAQPDAWSASVTPPSGWLATDGEVWDEFLDQYGMQVVDRADDIEWHLARTTRVRFEYTLWAFVAQRVR